MSRGCRHGGWLKFVPRCDGITNINQFIVNERELQEERMYRIEERLGILCGEEPATDDQLAMAIKEADEWVIEFYKSLD